MGHNLENSPVTPHKCYDVWYVAKQSCPWKRKRDLEKWNSMVRDCNNAIKENVGVVNA